MDDEKNFLLSLADGLNCLDPGLRILTAENGEKALKILESQSVDLVVTDLKMPVMNGFQLVSQMKKMHPGIPVIVLSSFLEPEAEIYLRSEGASLCIDKLNVNSLPEMIVKTGKKLDSDIGMEEEGVS